MTRDEMREKMARSLAAAFNGDVDPEGDLWEGWLNEIDAILAAIESTGHVIVPREPTKEMVEAGCHKYSPGMSGSLLRSARRLIVLVYRAMLTAYGQEGKS